MKILYFLAHPNAIGGAMTVLMTQAYIMQRRGHKVRVVIQNNSEDSHIPEYDELCKQYQLEYRTSQYPIATCIESIDIVGCMEVYENIRKIVMDYAPDLIHSIQLITTLELVARELSIPHLMNIYQISEGMFNLQWINVFPEYHSCDSEYYCRLWREGLGIKSRCIRTAYNKENIPVYETKENESLYELISIAVFSEHKRQLEIIKFVEQCKLNGLGIHINFVGSNACRYGEECRAYVEMHNLVEEVSFIGQVIDIERYLARADLLVHASTVESYPVVIVMAMANKVPVLATPVAGIPELLKDKNNCFLTEGYAYEDLYKAFKEYIAYRQNNKVDEIIGKAYSTYLENHTNEKVGIQLQNYYEQIIDRSRGKALLCKDVRKVFEDFTQNILSKSVYDETKKAIWFLYHISMLIQKMNYKSAYIWGAGNNGKIALEWCGILRIKVSGYIDSYKEGTHLGIPVYKPASVDWESADIVLVSIANTDICQTIMEALNGKGKTRNMNYFLMFNNPCL